ncbi:hypothetical protein EFJ58_23780 [Escherichia coli]|nr:hypothetical protein [Escherichia coli]
MSNTYQKRKASKEYGLYNKCKKLNDDELFRLLDDRNSLKRISSARVLQLRGGQDAVREGANKQVISSQVDSLIKISRIWADFFPANTSNQPI